MTNTSELLYHTYNSLFLRLPFQKINIKGTLLALFAEACSNGFDHGQSPEQIIHAFWEEHCEDYTEAERHQLLAYFIRYIERQVVLFDSVEDALFEDTHDLNGAGSLAYMLNRVNTPALKERLAQKLEDFSVRMVLTAHPTQFYPGKVLAIIDDLGREIRDKDLERIQLMLMQLGKTSFLNRKKPTPYDEALSLGWYLENVFYHALPDIVYRLYSAIGKDVAYCNNPNVLTLGFWPGGDRDGNPFVTADLTRDVTRRLREGALRCYYRDIRELRRRLTFKGVEERMAALEHRIYATLYKAGSHSVYTSAEELLGELLHIKRILYDQHESLFMDLLDRFVLKVRIFGFHFATLDIRQDSGKHEEIWEAIWKQKGQNGYSEWSEAERLSKLEQADFPLDEHLFPEDSIVFDTISMLRQIVPIQRENGPLGCHRYIISNCGSLLNVMEVLTLAKLTIGYSGSGGTVPLDVIPLFETVEDLAMAGEIMTALYRHPEYRKHLNAREGKQTIMLGFSDGTKDGGYLRANWSIYRAKEILTRISREEGVSVVFFDGRGGPPGRGGGNNASFYAAHGADIENREIQVTIQGQTISSTYGTRPAARYNIERLFTAGLENYLFGTHANELDAADHQLLDELAGAAYDAYYQLKSDKAFVPYLEKMTPLKWYGDSNIASRPTKRNAGQLKMEGLRAIPFVGAWAQMKQNIPGYYGFGAAIARIREQGTDAQLHDLYKKSLFFRTLVENSMQSLSKSNFKVTQYQEQDTEFGPFWLKLKEEYEQSLAQLKWLSQQETLLSENQNSRQSIALREDIVLPLIAIQQFALQQLRNDSLSPEEKESFQRMALRSMFGIINAARNAA